MSSCLVDSRDSFGCYAGGDVGLSLAILRYSPYHRYISSRATASKDAHMYLRKRSSTTSYKDFLKVVGTPPSLQAFGMSTNFRRFFFSQQVQCNMPQNSEIMRRVTFTYTREILSKSNIKNPMNFILNSPMCTHCMRKCRHFSFNTE